MPACGWLASRKRYRGILPHRKLTLLLRFMPICANGKGFAIRCRVGVWRYNGLVSRNKIGFYQGITPIVLFLMLWVCVGTSFTPRQAAVHQSVGLSAPAADAHPSCKCLMCKGGKKACCCCSHKKEMGFSASCDAAADPKKVASLALPRAVLPPALWVTLPAFALTAPVRGPAQGRALVKQAALPLVPPPRCLS